MTGLEKALTDYLALRRSMGYKLEDGRLLGQFVVWLDERGATHVTVSDAVEWARMAPSGSPNRQAYRLSAVRVFARHLQSVDPRTQVPPTDMLPARKTRATPYLYSDAEILALLDAARSLASPLRTATYQTLIALLAVSGMRPGEARRLDLTDIDFANNAVVIRDTKFGKSREVPLHPTTIAALRSYLGRRDRHPLPSHEQAVFISSTGIRLPASTMIGVFRKLARRAGLPHGATGRRPRMHDLRHTFAIRTLIDAYRTAQDIERQITLLSTYLGHVDPTSTYWYLSATPELMALAGDRLERYAKECS